MTEVLVDAEAASVLDVFAHRGEWTVEDWLALPEGGQRYEVIEGALVLMPSARPSHGRLQVNLASLLTRSNPDPHAWWVQSETGVQVGRNVFEPDVLVAAAGDDLPIPSAALVLAVEIESPSSLGNDRIMKPDAFAAARIPAYWRISRDPTTVHVYELSGDSLVEIVAATGDDLVSVRRPWPLSFHVRDLEP